MRKQACFRHANGLRPKWLPDQLYSYDLAERMHVHVFKSGHESKIWLDDLAVAFNRGFKSQEIAEVRRMISERRAEIVERWLEHGRNLN